MQVFRSCLNIHITHREIVKHVSILGGFQIIFTEEGLLNAKGWNSG